MSRRFTLSAAVAILLAAIPLSAQPAPTDSYVAPDGRGGADGSVNDPWDLATALAKGKVPAGRTIWMRGGVYFGPFDSALAGRRDAPVTLRSYPGERAVIADARAVGSGGTLNVRGEWAIYRDFNVTNTSADRRYSEERRPMAIEVQAPNTKFINLVIHDTGHIGFWKEAVDSEIYGSIIFNAGQFDPEAGGGRAAKIHGIYTQNNEGTKLVADNVIFNQFGWGIHAYPNPGDLDGFRIEGNVVFNNGRWAGDHLRYNNLLVNGYSPYAAERISITNNYFYHSESQRPIGKFSDANVCLGGADPVTNDDVAFRNNYIVNGLPGILMGSWKNVAVTGNTIVAPQRAVQFVPGAESKISSGEWNDNRYFVDGPGASAFTVDGQSMGFDDWRRKTGYDSGSQITLGRPSGMEVFVRPNRYEPGRAHVIVFNWDRQDAVEVDVSGVLAAGDRYELRNVEDYSGDPIASGIYSGGRLRVPIGGSTVSEPLGYRASDTSSDPQFRVFVLSKAPISSPPELRLTQLPVRSRTGQSARSVALANPEYAGLYRANDGKGDLRVERTGSALVAVAVSSPGSPRYSMVPLTDTLYRLEGGPEGSLLEFTVRGEQVVRLRILQGGQALTLFPVR
jgi:hypothetical protein